MPLTSIGTGFPSLQAVEDRLERIPSCRTQFNRARHPRARIGPATPTGLLPPQDRGQRPRIAKAPAYLAGSIPRQFATRPAPSTSFEFSITRPPDHSITRPPDRPDRSKRTRRPIGAHARRPESARTDVPNRPQTTPNSLPPMSFYLHVPRTYSYRLFDELRRHPVTT